MPATCECTLTRTVIISTRNGEGCEKLISKQIVYDKNVANAMMAEEKTRVYAAVKSCYGRAATAEDLITIGDIIVSANDIIAVGFRINPVQIIMTADNTDSNSAVNDNGDSETK